MTQTDTYKHITMYDNKQHNTRELVTSHVRADKQVIRCDDGPQLIILTLIMCPHSQLAAAWLAPVSLSLSHPTTAKLHSQSDSLGEYVQRLRFQ